MNFYCTATDYKIKGSKNRGGYALSISVSTTPPYKCRISGGRITKRFLDGPDFLGLGTKKRFLVQ